MAFAGAGSVLGLTCTSRSSLLSSSSLRRRSSSSLSDSEPDGEVGVCDRRLRLDEGEGESDGERWRDEDDGPDTRVTCDFNMINDQCSIRMFFSFDGRT